jgi:hypothetical protein
MIKIAGSVQRSFFFPADRRTAFEYYADMNNTISHLPHISLVGRHENDGLRMLYSTTELGIYRVRVYCDLRAEFDRRAWILRMQPVEAMQSVGWKAGMHSLSAPGHFTSQSIFHEDGAQTRIDYTLDLSATLPVPLELRFVPELVINALAHNITQRRFREIVEEFIKQSVGAFNRNGKEDPQQQNNG